MMSDGLGLFAVGLPVLAVGIIVHLLIWRRDLAGGVGREPAGVGRWFLAAALGLGILAFAVKLVIVASLGLFPNLFVPTRPPFDKPTPASLVDKPRPAHIASALVQNWTALPDVAPTPPGNPVTAAKIALGKRLFNDPRLSADGRIACASCHDLVNAAGADKRPVSLGIDGQRGTRNAPSVVNAGFLAPLFWDGRAASLEQQALGPLVNPVEMGQPSLDAVAAAVRAVPDYRPAFAAAFGDRAINIDRIAKAIAAFERSLVARDTPYDRFLAGDEKALSAAQQRGMWLFASLGCAVCHAGPTFSGAGVGARSPFSALLVDRSPDAVKLWLGADKGKAPATAATGVFRIPSLRNVALTAPYFHNGSVNDLSLAVRLMAEMQLGATTGGALPTDRFEISWSPLERRLTRTERKFVSDADIVDIVAFLEGLSSDALRQRAINTKPDPGR